MARLRALVEEAVPGLRLVAEARRDPLLAADDHRRYAIPDAPHEPSAEERAAVGEWMRAFEERWVDEPVPALEGRTPGEAWDDPRTRPDVEALLEGPGPMNGRRIRSLLQG